MCGRFTLRARPEEVASHFELDEVPELAARHNIAPGQPVAAVRVASTGDRKLLELRTWGLVPAWAKDPSIGSRLINARAETARDKPAFRAAVRKRRCLIPADGFYEWSGDTTPKQPWYIARPDGGVFAFAGLWEDWTGADGAEVHSCTILTTTANATLADIHGRMPVILDPADYPVWLGSHASDEARSALLKPCPEAWLERRTVGLRVNNPRFDDAACLEPAPPQPSQGTLL